MQTHLSFATGCPDEELLREFLSIDMLLPELQPLVQQTMIQTGEISNNLALHPIGPSSLHWSRQYEFPWALLNSNLTENSVCLDAGTGHSVFKYVLARRVKQVVGIDLDYTSLTMARKSIRRLGIKNISIEHANIATYKSDVLFDYVYCLSVLEHIPKQEDRIACIQNMFNLLKPNGTLLVSFDIIVKDGGEHEDSYIYEQSAIELFGVLGRMHGELQNCYSGVLRTGAVVITACVVAKKD